MKKSPRLLTPEQRERALEQARAFRALQDSVPPSERRDLTKTSPGKYDFPIGIAPDGTKYPTDAIYAFSKEAFALGYHKNPDGTPYPPSYKHQSTMPPEKAESATPPTTPPSPETAPPLETAPPPETGPPPRPLEESKPQTE